MVETHKHTFYYYLAPNQQSEDPSDWTNTNVLLQKGYRGVKTGQTVSAGSCLCSRRHITVNRVDYDLVGVVLGSVTIEQRFSETEHIFHSFMSYLKHME